MSTIADDLRAAADLLLAADFDFNKAKQIRADAIAPRLRAHADTLNRVLDEIAEYMVGGFVYTHDDIKRWADALRGDKP